MNNFNFNLLENTEGLVVYYITKDKKAIPYTDEFQREFTDRNLLKEAGLDKVQRYQWRKGERNNQSFKKICEILEERRNEEER